MIEVGNILKCNHRTEDYPLFVMVVRDPHPNPDHFKAVILVEAMADSTDKTGEIHDNWNKSAFDLSSWDELRNHLAIKEILDSIKDESGN